MKKLLLRLFIVFTTVLLAACTKDRVIPDNTVKTPTNPTGGGNAPDLSMPHINEFLAKNTINICPDSAGGSYATSDWIEIYNPNNSTINIGGYFITDSINDPTKFQIPTNQPNKTTIPAKGFIIVWCDDFTHLGPLHTSFSLSKGGEQLGFFKPDTTLIDTLTFGAQTQDISYGRITDGNSSWKYFTSPTPGETNY